MLSSWWRYVYWIVQVFFLQKYGIWTCSSPNRLESIILWWSWTRSILPSFSCFVRFLLMKLHVRDFVFPLFSSSAFCFIATHRCTLHPVHLQLHLSFGTIQTTRMELILFSTLQGLRTPPSPSSLPQPSFSCSMSSRSSSKCCLRSMFLISSLWWL